MFESRKEKTVIAKALKIVGSVTAEGLVEVNGQIDGELHGTSLVISHGAEVAGTVTAERVVVDGKVEGPIQGGDVVLKSKAHVVGDIQHQSLAIERGAYFDGRSVQVRGNGQTTGCLLLAQSRHAQCACADECPLLGVKRTWSGLVSMSANDPKRTLVSGYSDLSDYSDLREAMSMEKRYFTSDLSNLS